MTTRNVVVLVGSLRKQSFNRKIANEIIALAPASLNLEIVEIGQLSFFNQDLEATPQKQKSDHSSGRIERLEVHCSKPSPREK